MTPSTPLLDAVSAFESAIATEGNAETADATAAQKLAAATQAKADTAVALESAKSDVFSTGSTLIESIKGIIAPFAPVPEQ